jgi:hypothetical protein
MGYSTLVIAAIAAVYGFVRFRGSKFRSARYVTRPEAGWWSPWRFFDSTEWTQEGLLLRREILIWFAAVLVLVLASTCFASSAA